MDGISNTIEYRLQKKMLVCLFVDVVCASLPIIQSHNYIIYVCYSVTADWFVISFSHYNEPVVAFVHGCVNPTVEPLI